MISINKTFESELLASSCAKDRLRGLECIEAGGGLDIALLKLMLQDESPIVCKFGNRLMIGEIRFRVVEVLQKNFSKANIPPDIGPVLVRKQVPYREVVDKAKEALEGLLPKQRSSVCGRARRYLEKCVRPEKEHEEAVFAYIVLGVMGLIKYREELIDPVTYRVPLQREVMISQVARRPPVPYLLVNSLLDPGLTLGCIYFDSPDGHWTFKFAEGMEASDANKCIENILQNDNDFQNENLPENRQAILERLNILLPSKYQHSVITAPEQDNAAQNMSAVDVKEIAIPWKLVPPLPELMSQQHEQIFSEIAKQSECYIVVFASNTFSGDYIGKEGFRPSPAFLIAKSRWKWPNEGLMAVDPEDKGLLNMLSKANYSYDQYVEKLLTAGFVVGNAQEGYVIRGRNGIMFYPTYLIYGVYSKKMENLWYSPEGEVIRNELNIRFGQELVRYGAHDVWEYNDVIDEEDTRELFVCFCPNGNARSIINKGSLAEYCEYWRNEYGLSDETFGRLFW